VQVPDRPGFGFLLDEDRVRHHTVATWLSE
jgi:L-alanine-DL-glutamate epimerase-like enolase superfamily enzyme